MVVKDTNLCKVKQFEQYNGNLHNCWICEKWVEMEFLVDLDTAFEQQNKTKPSGQLQCRIHFDFNFYQPWPMNDLGEKSEELKGNWQVWWMVPQGQFHYFLSYGEIVFTPPMSQIEYVPITPKDVKHIQ